MSVEQPRPVRAPLLISDVTRARMLPYTTELSLDEKLHLLATVGGKFLVSDDFVPNDGTNVRPYPPSTAPRAATEAHMGGNQRKGRVIVLPLAFARAAARAASLPFHTSPTSIQLKLDAEPPLGRMTSDYTYPVGSSMWFEGKKELNSTFFTPIQNPTCADLCQLHLNAIHAFPGKEIFAV